MINNRIKDFYDLWVMSQRFTFQGQVLVRAIASTFQQRQTEITQLPPTALTPEFGQNTEKINLWHAFLKRNRLEAVQIELVDVLNELKGFLLPPLSAINNQAEFNQQWGPGGPWTSD